MSDERSEHYKAWCAVIHAMHEAHGGNGWGSIHESARESVVRFIKEHPAREKAQADLDSLVQYLQREGLTSRIDHTVFTSTLARLVANKLES